MRGEVQACAGTAPRRLTERRRRARLTESLDDFRFEADLAVFRLEAEILLVG
jgi:hypothetical protein